MWDMKTGRSRGYGFVAFRERADAEKAIKSMDGEWLGSRAIRCNWANQKGQPSISQQQAMAAMGMAPNAFGHHHFPTHGIQSYDMVVNQTPQWQTTCYVGNLTPYTTQNDLVPLFQNFGYVVETRMQADRGFAFIKMDTHENAAMAICQLNGYNVNGRPLKCSVCFFFPFFGSLDLLVLADTLPVGQGSSTNRPVRWLQRSTGWRPRLQRGPLLLSIRWPGGPNQPSRYVCTLETKDRFKSILMKFATGPGPAGRGWDQQANTFGGAPAVPGQGYGQTPANAGGYGRGQNVPGSTWTQPTNANFGNGFGAGGYQA